LETTYDLAIIGGGVNGCGIARDAAGRGLKVLLCEQNDLASGTSSAATKLIHGGLRYLEHYEFRLVREALTEREVLWGIAPHIVWPLRFVLPHHRGLRPAWMLRLGLFLYDHLGARERLPATRSLDLSTDPAGKPLKPGAFTRGFEYSDCWVDDARLVVLNARDAADRGATVLTRSKAIATVRAADHWMLTLRDTAGSTQAIRARAIVNAAGPWVGQVLRDTLRLEDKPSVRLVQGSHIVVNRLYDHDRCYIFQNADGRIFFAIPYEGNFTLIGTTDRDYEADPADVRASQEEITYLCQGASDYFAAPIGPTDIVWTYSGVRPLYDRGGDDAAQAATRDYVLSLSAPEGKASLLTVFGGKLTTYRRLAEHALEMLEPSFPGLRAKAGWTGRTALPGGDFPVGGFDDLVQELRGRWPFLTLPHATRLARQYGTYARAILGRARSLDDLGIHFGATLTGAEVAYSMDQEWTRSAEDLAWRRTKLGLYLTPAELGRLDRHIKEMLHPDEAAAS
jgi:glycerol-3-phosphate dehydrogenase